MLVGPMPPQELIDEFLPKAPKPTLPVKFRNIPKNTTKEENLYEPLVTTLNKCVSADFKFVLSASKTDEGEVKIRPDIGMVAKSPTQPTTSNTSLRRNPPRSKEAASARVQSIEQSFDWARCELSCEVKQKAASDPFNDSDKTLAFENIGVSPQSHRGQLISYYKAQASRQHRTHIFQLFIRGPYARFIRWDRSGAIVSASFNYVDRPQVLVEFLWRYSHMPPHARGWEVAKKLASPSQESLFRSKVSAFKSDTSTQALTSERDAHKDHNIDPSPPEKTAQATHALPTTQARRNIPDIEKILEEDYPTYAIEIPVSYDQDDCSSDDTLTGQDDNTGSLSVSVDTSSMLSLPTASAPYTTLLIRRPIYEPMSPFGRATRGYYAYDEEHERMVFYKDTWRNDYRDPEQQVEGQVCRTLRSKGIRLVPRIYAFGDYEDDDEKQKTLTDKFVLEKLPAWRKSYGKMRPHVHHFVVQEVLYPLTSFKNSKELVGICKNIVQTVLLARKKANILHRDVSMGNIMINADGEGVLADWDSSAYDGQTMRAPFRTGTWQFMAIALLQNPGTQNKLWHDLESTTLWVPLYTALRFLRHNEHIDYDIKEFFDQCQTIFKPGPNGKIASTTGGHLKELWLLKRQWRVLEFECKPLNRLFQELFEDWHVIYSNVADAESSETFQKKIEELTSDDYLANKFQKALDSPDWPETDDKVPDQYPRESTTKREKDRQKTMMSSHTREGSDEHADDVPAIPTTPPRNRNRKRRVSEVSSAQSSPEHKMQAKK